MFAPDLATPLRLPAPSIFLCPFAQSTIKRALTIASGAPSDQHASRDRQPPGDPEQNGI